MQLLRGVQLWLEGPEFKGAKRKSRLRASIFPDRLDGAQLVEGLDPQVGGLE
jgi:hypothetical protein